MLSTGKTERPRPERSLMVSPDFEKEMSGQDERGVKPPIVRLPGKTCLSAVLLSSNPWEQRDLDKRLLQIQKQRVRKCRSLEWTQRQFFVNQVFDSDLNLRFGQLMANQSNKNSRAASRANAVLPVRSNPMADRDKKRPCEAHSAVAKKGVKLPAIRRLSMGIFAPPLEASKQKIMKKRKLYRETNTLQRTLPADAQDSASLDSLRNGDIGAEENIHYEIVGESGGQTESLSAGDCIKQDNLPEIVEAEYEEESELTTRSSLPGRKAKGETVDDAQIANIEEPHIAPPDHTAIEERSVKTKSPFRGTYGDDEHVVCNEVLEQGGFLKGSDESEIPEKEKNKETGHTNISDITDSTSKGTLKEVVGTKSIVNENKQYVLSSASEESNRNQQTPVHPTENEGVVASEGSTGSDAETALDKAVQTSEYTDSSISSHRSVESIQEELSEDEDMAAEERCSPSTVDEEEDSLCRQEVITRLTRTLPAQLMMRANQNINKVILERKRLMLESSKATSLMDTSVDPRWQGLAASLVNSKQSLYLSE